MKLSVIILNYNVRYFLEQCIISVQKALTDMDSEIIVVDNHSTDDSCKMVMELFPDVILIANNRNFGFPKGNNIGVASAQGEYICILNPDTVVSEDTFLKSLKFAEQQANLGIVGVKLIDGTGNFLPESKRGVPTPFVAFTKIAGLYKVLPKERALGKYYASHLSENQTGKVDILVGAFMLMKKETYLEVGGFDEKCFMYADDIDLSYMVLKTGKKNFYFHETSVIHYKGESTVRDEAYMKHFQDAMNFFYLKHFRTSFFFDFFMKSGAFIFSLAKRRKANSRPTKTQKYILVSDNGKLEQKIESVLRKEVMVVKEIALLPTRGSEVIFDAAWCTFKTIIQQMERVKNPGITFKIVHPNRRFMIGSNSSYDRGQVVKFTDHR